MIVDSKGSSSDRRFKFGKNWSRFLKVLNEHRIHEAEKSLQTMLAIGRLEGKSFLDIGSGSGLFSLAAKRLGAQVYSFDYDPQSVACTQELKRLFYPRDDLWTIRQGSVLDLEFMKSLRKFDIVYSWGVLHHTGNLWLALANAAVPVAEKGLLFVAIYNDQGFRSRIWKRIKKLYVSSRLGRIFVLSAFLPAFFIEGLFHDISRGKNPVHRYREYQQQRGMSVLYDWIDWLGGYPFEVATPDRIVDFYCQKSLALKKFVPARGLGNNQFIFEKP
jgi:2-polyprenyl-6-hydroxyphenyl methylase/3-demethylubiquinone-9 3-methyltransferase